ncbi:hypothetical protein KYY02_22095 [Streptomyces pimonensis]|uniref:Integrase catalytic domain-containing protein n=1 Tax=Streptomyces pimonensis TaxID=2860288 RepID=A0ABV4J2X7_9ACTN
MTDVCSRKGAGWSIAHHMRTWLVTEATERAVAARDGRVRGVVLHTDRGAQGESDRSPQHLASWRFADGCAGSAAGGQAVRRYVVRSGPRAPPSPFRRLVQRPSRRLDADGPAPRAQGGVGSALDAQAAVSSRTA